MDGAPDFTVITCTRNREHSLKRMLASLASAKRPDGRGWEVLIVDNGSTDGTQEVIAGFADRLPIRSVVEPQAGLSNARNRGVAEAKGRFFIWTDDDVEVDENWLVAYADAFSHHPDGKFFGGRVIPQLEGSPPAWLMANRQHFSELLAERELGPEMRAFRDGHDEVPFGANFAIAADVQRAHRFNPNLGVSPNFKRLGEETAVFRRLKRDGVTGYWVPGAKVLHHIPQSRQTLDYIVTYQRSSGETWAALGDLDEVPFMGEPLNRDGLPLLGAPAWLWRMTYDAWVKYRLHRTVSSPDKWIPHLKRYGYYKGALDYLRR